MVRLIIFQTLFFSLSGITLAFPFENKLFADRKNARIFNGIPAKEDQFPFQAAIFITKHSSNKQSFCGGSLISPTWVLTAAHCLISAQTLKIYLGTISLRDPTGRLTPPIKNFTIHDGFNPKTAQNDIALIELQDPIDLKPIFLPSETVQNGRKVTVAGWGRTSDGSSISQRLLYANLTVITNEKCAETFPGMITERVVCAEGRDLQNPCEGDSGGPLFYMKNSSFFQVGLVSFTEGSRCEDNGAPAGFTRISAYTSWIQNYTGLYYL